MKKKQIINILLIVLFLIFIMVSYEIGFEKGKETGKAFFDVLMEMLKILPCAFVLIGLFEVWVDKETIIKHLGDSSGAKGYFWVMLLAGFSIGGLYVAFPLAETLHKKGASLKVVFAYLGFAGIFRIPMTIFELSFLGIPFTLVRLLVTAPLFLVTGIVMGTILKKSGFEIRADKKPGVDIERNE